jgi:16S rRNA A1518/A1519 N6-dimethyltransferase RsmA/KsgA/DIM1 with predicted DNA glycosylase/AP lyase activity
LDAALSTLAIPPTERAEKLSLEQLAALTALLADKRNGV